MGKSRGAGEYWGAGNRVSTSYTNALQNSFTSYRHFVTRNDFKTLIVLKPHAAKNKIKKKVSD